MPLKTLYTSKVDSNDKIRNPNENGAFRTYFKDWFIITFWFKQSLLKSDTGVKKKKKIPYITTIDIQR